MSALLDVTPKEPQSRLIPLPSAGESDISLRVAVVRSLELDLSPTCLAVHESLFAISERVEARSGGLVDTVSVGQAAGVFAAVLSNTMWLRVPLLCFRRLTSFVLAVHHVWRPGNTSKISTGESKCLVSIFVNFGHE